MIMKNDGFWGDSYCHLSYNQTVSVAELSDSC